MTAPAKPPKLIGNKLLYDFQPKARYFIECPKCGREFEVENKLFPEGGCMGCGIVMRERYIPQPDSSDGMGMRVYDFISKEPTDDQ